MTGIDWLREGVHTIDPADYHADPCKEPALSAGLAHTLLTRSPKHAWTDSRRLNPDFRERQRDSFDLGTAAHDLWLRGREDLILVVDADSWQTKHAKEQRAEAREAGLTPLLAKDWARVQEMIAAIRVQLAERDDDPPLFAEGGKPEETVIWQERGIWCRALVDWLHPEHGISDLKTTAASANPAAWSRTTMWNIGADIELAFHSRGVRAVTGQPCLMRFVVVEVQPPYALSVVTLSHDALRHANEKVDEAIDTWRECLASGEWPAYTRDLFAADAPPWREMEWLERQAIERTAA